MIPSRTLPPSWSWTLFGEVARVASNLVDPAKYQDLPHIAPNHIESRMGRLLPYSTVAEDRVTSSKHLFYRGQILYSKIRPYLAKAVEAPFDGLCSADMYPIDTPLVPRFLLYWLLTSDFTQFASQVQGRTVLPKINRAQLEALPVPLAPLREQERIVAAIEEQFSRLDAGVAALERARKNLMRMRSMAFALIADSVETWCTLGEIAEVVGGVTKDAKRQSDPTFVEVPYLRVANVQRGYLDLSSITTIRVPAATADKLRLETGDILFNEGGDRDKLGRGWIWEGQIKDCIHQNHVFRARLLTDEFEPRFVSMHGNTFGRTWFEKMGKQTTNLASLNLATLKSFPVPDLPVERQREIIAEVESQLSVLDSLQSVIDQSLIRSNSLRSSILGWAFAGQLVPQDPTDEPASVLLERIAAERASSNDPRSPRGRRPRVLREEASA